MRMYDYENDVVLAKGKENESMKPVTKALQYHDVYVLNAFLVSMFPNINTRSTMLICIVREHAKPSSASNPTTDLHQTAFYFPDPVPFPPSPA